MDFGMFGSWVVVGLLAGWLAGFVMKGGGYGLIGDLVLVRSPAEARSRSPRPEPSCTAQI